MGWLEPYARGLNQEKFKFKSLKFKSLKWAGQYLIRMTSKARSQLINLYLPTQQNISCSIKLKGSCLFFC